MTFQTMTFPSRVSDFRRAGCCATCQGPSLWRSPAYTLRRPSMSSAHRYTVLDSYRIIITYLTKCVNWYRAGFNPRPIWLHSTACRWFKRVPRWSRSEIRNRGKSYWEAVWSENRQITSRLLSLPPAPENTLSLVHLIMFALGNHSCW